MSRRYWVNEDIQVNRVTIHREPCRYVRKRATLVPKHPERSRWYGPLPNAQSAVDVAESCKRNTMRSCVVCCKT